MPAIKPNESKKTKKTRGWKIPADVEVLEYELLYQSSAWPNHRFVTDTWQDLGHCRRHRQWRNWMRQAKEFQTWLQGQERLERHSFQHTTVK